MRFVADREPLASCRAHDETHVVVEVLRLGAARGNRVTIEIENFRIDDEIRQSRFLLSFAQGDAGEIGIAVGVAAELEPEPELAMVREQYAPAVCAHEPSRTGQMSDREFAMRGIGVPAHELDEAIGRRRTLRMARRETFECRAPGLLLRFEGAACRVLSVHDRLRLPPSLVSRMLPPLRRRPVPHTRTASQASSPGLPFGGLPGSPWGGCNDFLARKAARQDYRNRREKVA